MVFNLKPVLPVYNACPDQVVKELRTLYYDRLIGHLPRDEELDLLIAILLENNGSLYGNLKRICETNLGLVSQCCLSMYASKENKRCLANIALKINVKVGGRNTVLVDALSNSIPLVTDRPTIIFGADVTHPHPGEYSSPSIAALSFCSINSFKHCLVVVDSQDWPEVTKYNGLVCAQSSFEERINDLYTAETDSCNAGGMVREHLKSFYRATGRKPERIIFYRDGVGEGQFYNVLLHEVDAIHMACESLEPNYRPPVTFVVVQKRHHTRFFADNHADSVSVDGSGNILPGTVVDSMICHPTEFDFYLCSHAGVQGTSCPAHYHVLWDENKFTANDLQTLTYRLCYTYVRSTNSVSIVPPVYYAHLAAFRARFYIEPENRSVSGRGAEARATQPERVKTEVRPLPPLRRNVKKVMFYC